MNRRTTMSLVLVLGASLMLTSTLFAQIQSTISCPAGHGYLDTLSLMVMDPGLSANHHMEGFDPTTGNPSSYVYTEWWQSNNKVWYVKNPQGNPWDIKLYDYQPGIPSQGYIYQWVTELDTWNGVNHWSDPTSCRKHNNGSNTSTADLSYPIVARCAVPGGENGSFWVSAPPTQPHNSQYYTYVNGAIQPPQNLQNALMELKGPGGPLTLYWSSDTSQPFSVNTIIFQYTYSCSQQNVNYCKSREVFEFAYDATTNPYDGIKHSYGWVRWRFYKNATNGDGSAANWGQPVQTSYSNHVVVGQTTVNFQCF
jgi:hypothetical protein